MKKIPTLLDLYEAIKPYTIYCDMDGVLCDFDQGYEKLTGESTDEANAKGKSYFWKLFRESVGKNEKDFWANLPWQPGGEDLWTFISPYNPNILKNRDAKIYSWIRNLNRYDSFNLRIEFL